MDTPEKALAELEELARRGALTLDAAANALRALALDDDAADVAWFCDRGRPLAPLPGLRFLARTAHDLALTYDLSTLDTEKQRGRLLDRYRLVLGAAIEQVQTLPGGPCP